MPKKVILIVEDDNLYFKKSKNKLSEFSQIEILWAQTIDQAETIFNETSAIDLIIMDACVPGDEPTTEPLVKKIVATGYSNPIIACSSIPNYCKRLVYAGATHKADKYEAANLALKLLDF